jgi:hypothetical protein
MVESFMNDLPMSSEDPGGVRILQGCVAKITVGLGLFFFFFFFLILF